MEEDTLLICRKTGEDRGRQGKTVTRLKNNIHDYSRLNFKPFHVAISEGSHIAVGISSSGLSFVVVSAPSCRRFRVASPVGIYPNRASA